MLKESQIHGPDQQNYTYQEMISELRKLNSCGYGIYVGADSKVVKDRVSFVVAVCVYKPSTGCKIFWVKNKLPKVEFPNLRKRLMFEAYKALEVAMEIEDEIEISGFMNNRGIGIHLDIGFDEKISRSAMFRTEFESLITSQGYTCTIKPDSWASVAADRFCRH